MEASLSNKLSLDFLHLVGKLKETPRTGWLRTIGKPESVADHSYRLAILALFAPDGVNRERCMLLALCHDMAESVVGDIPTYANVPKEHKQKLEDSGFRYISSLLQGRPELAKYIRDAWLEYEKGETPEAQWVTEMDKFECLVQASEYEKKTYGEKDLNEFQGLSSKIKSPLGMELLETLQQERQSYSSKLTRRMPVIFVIGAPGVDKKIHCARLSQNLGLQCISLVEVLREKSDDQTYPHAEFLRGCLADDAIVPTDLSIKLLEEKINEVKKWSLVHGFPKDMQDLLEFEEQVQKTNYILCLNSSAPLQKPLCEAELKTFEGFKASLKNHVHTHYKDVIVDDSMAKTVDEMIAYADSEDK